MPYKDKESRREAYRRWYKRNKHRNDVRCKSKTQRTRVREWFAEWKKGKSCQTCNESHPACISFHHRDSEDKELEISNLVVQGYGIKTIMVEVAKCDVLCHNCHAKLHWEEKQGVAQSG